MKIKGKVRLGYLFYLITIINGHIKRCPPYLRSSLIIKQINKNIVLFPLNAILKNDLHFELLDKIIGTYFIP
jgi:hypothetical protein